MNNLYKNISEVLENKLAQRKFGIEPSPAGMGPLFLILTLGPDLVVFSSWVDDYNEALRKFKELYAINSTPWAELDLTLVICVEKKSEENEEICGKIEQDSYFCRKFVIEYQSQQACLKELDSLPFMPLSIKEIITYRPVLDAKKLLIENGFKATLANDLIARYIKKADTIVDHLNDGKYGDLNWEAKNIEAPNIGAGEFKPEIRLKEIEIANFRAFKGVHKFNLDADLIVLYGQNGLGKTSFFDSIDFLCTGGEATIENKVGRWDAKRIISALKHLDAEVEDSSVKALISKDNNEFILERQMSNRTDATIDNESFNSNEILQKLSGFDEELARMGVDKFSKLFRASHLFGQDFQSLTFQLYKSSRLPEEVLSKMLAFQDYVQALRRIDEIKLRFKRDIENKTLEMKHFIDTKDELEKEANELAKLTQPLEGSNIIQEKGAELLSKLKKEENIFIEMEDNNFEKQDVLEWRLKVEVRLKEIEESLVILKQLQAKFSTFKKNHEEMAKEKELVEHLNNLVSKIDTNLKKKNVIFTELNAEIERKLKEKAKLQKRNFDLDWFFKEKSEYKKIDTQIAIEKNNIKLINEKIIKVVKEYELISGELISFRKKREIVSTQLKELEGVRNEYIGFRGVNSEWLQKDKQIKNCEQNIHKLEGLLRAVVEKETTLNDKRNRVLKLREALHNEISLIQTSMSEFDNILDRVEKYITDNVCPVCGKNYASREELLLKLKLQKNKRPVGLQQKKVQLRHFDNEIVGFKKEENNLKQERTVYVEDITKTKIQKENLEKEISIFMIKATSLKLPAAIQNLNVNIELKIQKYSEQIIAKSNEESSLKKKIAEIEKKASAILAQKTEYSEEIRIAESQKKHFMERISSIHSAITGRNISLEENLEQLEEEFCSNKIELNQVLEKIKMSQKRASELEKEMVELNMELKKNNSQISSKNNKVKKLDTALNEVRQLMSKLHVKSDATDKEIRQIEKLIKEENTRLNETYKNIVNFETIFDSAMISANMAKVKAKISEIKGSVASLEKDREKIIEYQKIFQDAQEALEKTRDKSLKLYIEKYGPLASIIQKRLRKPYGFGELKLRKEKGEIVVEVERRKKNILPSDYFSASQINIVSLSLFLSATLTQTWSKFSTILLDDPVTHFDDLNAYSFIDLLRNLIINEQVGKGHQFIISTCEDRLYHLLRQKFRMFSNRVKFFIFESIGENGPIWKEADKKN